MNNKRIVVTGASRGLGRAIASLLAQKGNCVGVNFLSSDAAAESLAARFPDQIQLLKADVRDPCAINDAISDFGKRNGGLDCLVNNAGFHSSPLLIRKSIADIRAEIETNLLGAIFATRAALPFMMKQRDGMIINISSVAADQARPGLSVYSASKAGLESFARSIALEYKSRGIRALCLRFGPIQTDMLAHLPPSEYEGAVNRTISGKATSPEDAAAIVVRAISDNCNLQTGCVHTYDDGYSL